MFVIIVADVVTEFIEGLVETYPGLQYLDGFPEVFIFVLFCFYLLYFSCIEPYLWKVIFDYHIFNYVVIQVKVVLRADVAAASYDKVAIISGLEACNPMACFSITWIHTLFHDFLGSFYAQFELLAM